MTGWGQTGPYAPYAGHDLNYIALSGALHAIGRAGQGPVRLSRWWATLAAAAGLWLSQ
jgi:crotonobetainyl-CoA:carnitine CoA-transferase CaiB-like acyl-CoA transferase